MDECIKEEIKNMIGEKEEKEQRNEYIKRISKGEENIEKKIRDMIREIMNRLSEKRNDEYKKWVEIGMVLYKFDLIDEWKKFSMKSKKYDEREIDRKVKTFSKSEGHGIGSLIKWLKEDDKEKYKEIIKKDKGYDKGNNE